MKSVSVIVIVIVALTCGVVHADSGSGSAAAGSAAAGSGSATATDNKVEPPAGNLRKTCTDAMNADPSFAKSIVEIADKEAADRRLEATEKEHLDAAMHIEKDEKHVILAYAAMWIIAAGFVLFLWRRQQALKAEIAQLRRDLEKEAT